jgi:cytochrome c553
VAGYVALSGRGDAAAEGCKRCHAADGSGGPEGAFPSLAGQRSEYTFNALDAYARGGRPSGIMQPIAAAMSADEMRRAAEHYAKLSSVRAGAATDSSAVERGKQLANRGVPEQNVPACAECHGPRRTRRNAGYPRLAGQHASYLVQQLELFRARVRGGSKYAHLMDKVAPRLSDAQMRDVAAYYASLGSDED